MTLRCWECKSCGWEHWCRDGSRPPSTCPGCHQPNRTWIGHFQGARSSCELEELTDNLAALKAGDPIDVLANDGHWVSGRFVGWVADGLAAAIEAHYKGETLRSVGRFAIRPRVVDA